MPFHCSNEDSKKMNASKNESVEGGDITDGGRGEIVEGRWPLSLTWYNFTPSMHTLLHSLQHAGWNY